MTRQEIVLTIASNILPDAQKLALKYPGRAKAVEVNVSEEASISPLVEDCDLVISYIPPFLHIHVAKQCLRHGKNLVTASYVSPEMKALHGEAAAKGLIFLNELGLDPGIDHLSAMKIID